MKIPNMITNIAITVTKFRVAKEIVDMLIKQSFLMNVAILTFATCHMKVTVRVS